MLERNQSRIPIFDLRASVHRLNQTGSYGNSARNVVIVPTAESWNKVIAKNVDLKERPGSGSLGAELAIRRPHIGTLDSVPGLGLRSHQPTGYGGNHTRVCPFFGDGKITLMTLSKESEGRR